MGKFFIGYLTEIKLKIWMGTFWKVSYHLKFWYGLPAFVQQTIYQVRTEMRQSLNYSKAYKHYEKFKNGQAF